MSDLQDIQDLYNPQYSAVVNLQYQGASLLRNAVYSETLVGGNSHIFRYMQKGTSTAVRRGDRILPQNSVFESPTAIIKDYEVQDVILRIDLKKGIAIPNAIQNIALNAIQAIGRRLDQIIIDDGLTATTNTIPDFDSTTGFTDSKNISLIKKFFRKNAAVSFGQLFVLATADQELQLRSNPTIQNILTSDTKVLEQFSGANYVKYQDIIFIFMEDRTEGGVPYISGNRHCFAFMQQGVGLALQEELLNANGVLPDYSGGGGIVLSSVLSAGATIIRPECVAEIPVNETL
jgi:hypothetical protein